MISRRLAKFPKKNSRFCASIRSRSASALSHPLVSVRAGTGNRLPTFRIDLRQRGQARNRASAFAVCRHSKQTKVELVGIRYRLMCHTRDCASLLLTKPHWWTQIGQGIRCDTLSATLRLRALVCPRARTDPRPQHAVRFTYPRRGPRSPRAHGSIRHLAFDFWLRARFPCLSLLCVRRCGLRPFLI